MSNGTNDEELQGILGLFFRPLRRTRNVLTTRQGKRNRVLEDATDETVIDEAGSINTVVTKEAHFLDCGHFGDGNVAGRCACGAIVCRSCVSQCSLCGIPLCPVDRLARDSQVFCRSCLEDLMRRERLLGVGKFFASFFVDFGKDRK